MEIMFSMSKRNTIKNMKKTTYSISMKETTFSISTKEISIMRSKLAHHQYDNEHVQKKSYIQLQQENSEVFEKNTKLVSENLSLRQVSLAVVDFVCLFV